MRFSKVGVGDGVLASSFRGCFGEGMSLLPSASTPEKKYENETHFFFLNLFFLQLLHVAAALQEKASHAFRLRVQRTLPGH